MSKTSTVLSKEDFREELAKEIKRRLLLDPNDVNLDDSLDNYYKGYIGGQTIKELVTEIRDDSDLDDMDGPWGF